MTALPFYFPTRVIVVDDEPQVLRMTSLLFAQHPDVAEVVTFDRAPAALAYVRAAAARQPRLDAFAAARVHDEIDDHDRSPATVRRLVDIRVSEVRAVLDDPARHSLHAVVFCDFAMPDMNGLEFFAQLHDPSLRRVLLTAVCDERRAVDAFNRGWIHQFVHKADAAGPRGLEAVLAAQVRDFLAERTRHLTAALTLADTGRLLEHDSLPALLHHLQRTAGVREAAFTVAPPGYRIRSPGSGADWQATTCQLLLADNDLFLRAERVVTEIDSPPELAAALRARQIMPTGRNHQPIYEADAGWAALAVPAQQWVPPADMRTTINPTPLYWAVID